MIFGVVGAAYSAEYYVRMNVIMIYMGCKHIRKFSFKYFISKLPAYTVGFIFCNLS